jgi:hypothetical protein
MISVEEKSVLEARRILGQARPAEPGGEAATPFSLASYVDPKDMAPLREQVAAIHAKRAEVAEMAGKVSELESALLRIDIAQPVISDDLAAQIMAGKKIEDLKPKAGPNLPAALQGFTREQIEAAKRAVEKKLTALRGEASALETKLKDLESTVLRRALQRATDAYVAVVQTQLAPLHVAIDAGHTLSRWENDNYLRKWRDEEVLAPPLAERMTVTQPPPFSPGWPSIAKFENGKGVPDALESWRRFVKATVGWSSL